MIRQSDGEIVSFKARRGSDKYLNKNLEKPISIIENDFIIFELIKPITFHGNTLF